MAELRLEVLLEAERGGLSVTDVCRRFGISRQIKRITGIDVGIWRRVSLG